MARISAAVLACLCRFALAAPYSFITLGDWGSVALGNPEHTKTVRDVAEQMGKVAAEKAAQFVVNVGDNFYHCGIQSTSDKQIEEDYTSVYTAPSLQVPWYSALGNHEYGYNVDAQVEFTQADPTRRWYMPARYYAKRVALAAGQHLTMIVLDTNPCIAAYRSSDASGWDPCSSEWPTCDPIKEGECRFHENIVSQDCDAQHAWLREQLGSVDRSDWLLVVGHHPADEIDVRDFLSVVQGHGFDLYLNGHVHDLEHYAIDGNGAYVTSGAGGMVHTEDQDNDPRCKVGDAGFLGAFERRSEMIFKETTAGFTLHTFSEDFATLRTDFYSYTGEVLHNFTISKGKPSPAPPPGPGPAPGPPAKCGGAGAWPCASGCTYVHKASERKCSVEATGALTAPRCPLDARSAAAAPRRSPSEAPGGLLRRPLGRCGYRSGLQQAVPACGHLAVALMI
eukprot:CAMPEP_0171172786 /NCGR_PEP_ID=MMETSP0790-20130122/9894_1 /TAXON_ID=2925 /ORGANISM="Alexandrium catenella, Strain OF101" /LENGTH=450 /DNA_ID=CAMNT_0011637645 /DNA_START=88 /DNA_END=1438 /DNA_ORIENTATION=+